MGGGQLDFIRGQHRLFRGDRRPEISARNFVL